MLVTHSLRGEGFDASEDGTGRGTPIVYAFDHQSGGDCRGLDLREVAQLQACQTPAVMVHWQQGGGEVEDNVSGALRANAEHSYQFARIHSTVRRLTPRECERLQGFPDDWTRIWRKRVSANALKSAHFTKYRDMYDALGDGWLRSVADDPRYKALGNSMAVPCVEFILGNLMEVDK